MHLIIIGSYLYILERQEGKLQNQVIIVDIDNLQV